MARLLAPVNFSSLVIDPVGHVSPVIRTLSINQQEIYYTGPRKRYYHITMWLLPHYNVVHKDSRSQCEQPPIVIKADMWTGVGPVSIVCTVYKWHHLLWAHSWYLALIRLCLRILDIQLLPPPLSAVRFQILCCFQLDLGTGRKHMNSGCLI